MTAPSPNQELARTPGEMLQREGADQSPSPHVDDDIARAVDRLLNTHGG